MLSLVSPANRAIAAPPDIRFLEGPSPFPPDMSFLFLLHSSPLLLFLTRAFSSPGTFTKPLSPCGAPSNWHQRAVPNSQTHERPLGRAYQRSFPLSCLSISHSLVRAFVCPSSSSSSFFFFLFFFFCPPVSLKLTRPRGVVLFLRGEFESMARHRSKLCSFSPLFIRTR